MIKRLPVLICTLGLLGAPANAQPAFTWTGLLGLGVEEVRAAVSAIAACGIIQPMEYVLPVDFAEREPAVAAWAAPLGGGVIHVEPFRSESLKTFSCSIGDQANVWVLAHGQTVFEIHLRYHRCDGRPLDCRVQPLGIDTTARQRYHDSIYANPVVGALANQITDEEADEYLAASRLLRTNEYVDFKWGDLTRCGVIGLYSTPYRCLFGIVIQDGVISSVSFVDSQITETPFVTHQHFAEISLGTIARESFLAELAALIATDRERRNAEQQRQEQQDEALNLAR